MFMLLVDGCHFNQMMHISVYLGKPFVFLPNLKNRNNLVLCMNNLVIVLNTGGYDMEEKAARAYDLAALKYWGPSTHINFPV